MMGKDVIAQAQSGEEGERIFLQRVSSLELYSTLRGDERKMYTPSFWSEHSNADVTFL